MSRVMFMTSRIACLAFLAAVAGASCARAEAPGFAFNLGANTDYVFRGVSQTQGDPSVFGGVDATWGVGYAGAWVSNVDFGDATDAEFDLYGGIRPKVGPVSLDLGVIYYGYAGAPSGADYGYWEAKAAASAPAGPATVGVAAYYSPDFFGAAGEAFYYEANAQVAIPQTKASVSGAVGRQWVEGPGDYTTWNVGVGYQLTDHLGLDVRYHDTDAHDLGDIYDGRVVGGLKLTW